MKNVQYPSTVLLLFALGLSGCDLIGDIFAAGVWVGVIAVVLVVGLIVWLVSKSRT
jgi:hypothetical protein